MIVLPDRNIPRARFLLPTQEREWRAPSHSISRGSPTQRTRFRARAMTHDGVVLWIGWFDDRADFDAFLWAIATGSLPYERQLWNLPTPMWPDLPLGLLYDFASVSFTTYTATGNNAVTVPSRALAAVIKAWGAGGGGGGYQTNSSYHGGVGGGGGFAGAEITVTPGATLIVRVGANGVLGGNNTGGGSAGSGGGLSGVFLSSFAFANRLLIAGGGGGAGASGGSGHGGAGGAGGGSTGGSGANGTGSSYGGGGGGGTQSAGGAAGQGATTYPAQYDGSALQGSEGRSGGTPPTAANDSTAGTGGRYTSNCGGGGGGGGGLYGGGGAGRGGGSSGGGGGGAGSNYVSGTNTTSTQASGQTAANNADPDYVSGKGNGGSWSSSGGNGSNGTNGVVVMGFVYPCSGFNMPMLGM